MKIADGLLLMKDIAEEMGRLKSFASKEAWEYRSIEKDAKWVPTFDLDANHARMKALSKLHRKLSRSISLTNNHQELMGINDADYSDWV